MKYRPGQFCGEMSDVKHSRHTSCVTHYTTHMRFLEHIRCHTSHVTHHVTRHTSHVKHHVTHHTSHITHHISHITHHTSHITHHTSHITHHISHITHHTSHITRHSSKSTYDSTFPSYDAAPRAKAESSGGTCSAMVTMRTLVIIMACLTRLHSD